MTAPLLLPNTDLVAVGWLRRNAKFVDKGIGIATRLPSDSAALRAGFIVVSTVGGTPMPDLPLRQPVVQVSCWASPASDASQKTPWNHASQLAEWCWEQTFDRTQQNVDLSFSLPGYAHARVMSVVALTEPRRMEGDEGLDARVDIELQFYWTGV